MQKWTHMRVCEGCPQSFHLTHQLLSNDWIFSLLILNIPLAPAAPRNVFAHTRRWSSKWGGMVTCLFNSGYWISCGRDEVSNKHSKAVKQYTVSMLLIKVLYCLWDSRTAGSEGGHTELSDTRRSGRPTTAVILALLQRAAELVGNDWRITARNFAAGPSASKRFVNKITDALRYSKCVLPGFPGA
jgi:hypothetical protein